MNRLPFGIFLIAVLATAPLFAAVPIAGSMQLTATARSIDKNFVATNPSHNAWGTLLSPLAVSVSASLLDNANNPAITVHGSGTANWLDANHGAVSFSNLGWEFSNSAGYADLRVPLSSLKTDPNWLYQFVANTNSTFTMHGQVTGHDNLFGLFGWALRVYEGTNETLGGLTSPTNPNATWDFQMSLLAGKTYTATLANNANIQRPSSGTSMGSMNAQFTWQISGPIPEPSTILLAIFALAALSTRRRKSVPRNRV